MTKLTQAGARVAAEGAEREALAGKGKAGLQRLKHCCERQGADIPWCHPSVDKRGLLRACNNPERHSWVDLSPGGKDLHRKRLNGQGQRALKY